MAGEIPSEPLSRPPFISLVRHGSGTGEQDCAQLTRRASLSSGFGAAGASAGASAGTGISGRISIMLRAGAKRRSQREISSGLVGVCDLEMGEQAGNQC